MTVKQLLEELSKERHDEKGTDVILVVDGVETPLVIIELDKERNVVLFIGNYKEQE